jgi:hypothetical protein
MNVFDRMFSGNKFKSKYPLLDKYVIDSSVRDNLLKNQDLFRKYKSNETMIKAFVFELDKHFDKETIYKIIRDSIFTMPDITLSSFIESYLNSDEVTKSNSDVIRYYKKISQYGVDSTKYIEKNGIITNRSFKEVPNKVLTERFNTANVNDYMFNGIRISRVFDSLSYNEKMLLLDLLENGIYNSFNTIYDLKLEKYNIHNHFDIKTLLGLLITNEIDTEILNKDVISKVGEDNLLFLSYMIFGMNFGQSVTRIIKYYISKGKYELISTMIVKGLIPALEGLSIQDIKNVDDQDLLRLLDKKMNTEGIFLSLNKNAA